MNFLNQKTIKNNIEFSGVGLHSGKIANLKLKPADPNSGVIFKRTDLKNNNYVHPNFLNVCNTSLNTTIANEYNVKVSTIEHLMGALFVLGVDNILIEIDNEEVPILDGSALQFIEKIQSAGMEENKQPIKVIKINKEINFRDNEKFINFKPSKFSLDIDFQIQYNNSLIGNQRNKVNVYEDDLNEIYSSRTFCLYEDIETIKKIGLAKGGSLENAIVVKGENILNDGGLRNSREFVNHKILDCIGDLYTCGYKIIGSIECSQGGHYLTNQGLRKLLCNKENFSIIEIQEKNLPHTIINKNLLRAIA